MEVISFLSTKDNRDRNSSEIIINANNKDKEISFTPSTPNGSEIIMRLMQRENDIMVLETTLKRIQEHNTNLLDQQFTLEVENKQLQTALSSMSNNYEEIYTDYINISKYNSILLNNIKELNETIRELENKITN